uniref:Uncharacterized protein n=1 Tax=Graphocephala atropunctata TaxID=36148 RepID=A0A1B6M6Q0_9HEMI
MGGKENVEGEESWEPRYGNDSRPWLLGLSDIPQPSIASTTKETYTADWPAKPRTEGIRRQLLRKALWEQTRREVADELEMAEEPTVTTTEYTETFIKDGFVARPLQTDPELHRRYPLYGDGGVSVWSERFPSLPGATRAPHTRHRFRRYAGFTKPLDQTLDDDPQETR